MNKNSVFISTTVQLAAKLMNSNPSKLSPDSMRTVPAKFTPGPWKVKAMANGDLPDGTLIVVGSNTQPGFTGACICSFAPPGKITPEDEINAALVAAAPEMLAALVARQKADDELDRAHDPECWELPYPNVEQIRAIQAAQKLMDEADKLATIAIMKATESASS